MCNKEDYLRNHNHNRNKVILPVLRNAHHIPLYYISFHGIYDSQTTFGIPVPIVPKNSYILEPCLPGEIVHEHIDTYLWPVCHYEFREKFLHTLSLHSSEPPATPYEEAIKQLHVHLPETPYMNRTLTPEAGRGGRSFFQGIYKLDHKTNYTSAPPKNGDTLYKGFIKILTEGSLPTSTDEIVQLIQATDKDAADGAIFVFVSCGTIAKLSNDELEFLHKLATEKDLEFMLAHDGHTRRDSYDAYMHDEKFVELDSTYRRRELRKRPVCKELDQL